MVFTSFHKVFNIYQLTQDQEYSKETKSQNQSGRSLPLLDLFSVVSWPPSPASQPATTTEMPRHFSVLGFFI